MKLFTILHTNDLHSSLIGAGPSSEYAPLGNANDGTTGGFARLSTLIHQRRDVRMKQGPLLVLDAGDYSMGTPFGAATRETGGELQLMALMGYDATTLGSHDFDFGPEGLAKSIGTAAKAGRVPAVVAANIDFETASGKLDSLRPLVSRGTIRRHILIDRAEIRFGIFGLLGKNAMNRAPGAAPFTFSDPQRTARDLARWLRDHEKADIVICLSHGGGDAGTDGSSVPGDDVRLAEAVPELDVIVSGHGHLKLKRPILVNRRTPIVQAGKNSENLGELVMALGVDGPQMMSYRLYDVNGSVPGDRAIESEILRLASTTNRVVFAPNGYSINKPLAVTERDLPWDAADDAVRAPLANLVTDAIRRATRTDIGLTLSGLIQTGLVRGKSGVQTVYDLFSVSPFGCGVLDSESGNGLLSFSLTARELKRLIEFFLADSASGSHDCFPLTSGMKFRFDRSRGKYNAVTQIEIGDFEAGYRTLDFTSAHRRLYSIGCNVAVGGAVAAIASATRGKLPVIPKSSTGEPLQFRSDEHPSARRKSSHFSHLPKGIIDKRCIVTSTRGNTVREIKEWQAIVDYVADLPRVDGELPLIRAGKQASEIRAAEAN